MGRKCSYLMLCTMCYEGLLANTVADWEKGRLDELDVEKIALKGLLL